MDASSTSRNYLLCILSSPRPSDGGAVESPPPRPHLPNRSIQAAVTTNVRRTCPQYSQVTPRGHHRAGSPTREIPLNTVHANTSSTSRPTSRSRHNLEEKDARRHVGDRRTSVRPSALEEVKWKRTEVQLVGTRISTESSGIPLHRCNVLVDVQRATTHMPPSTTQRRAEGAPSPIRRHRYERALEKDTNEETPPEQSPTHDLPNENMRHHRPSRVRSRRKVGKNSARCRQQAGVSRNSRRRVGEKSAGGRQSVQKEIGGKSASREPVVGRPTSGRQSAGKGGVSRQAVGEKSAKSRRRVGEKSAGSQRAADEYNSSRQEVGKQSAISRREAGVKSACRRGEEPPNGSVGICPGPPTARRRREINTTISAKTCRRRVYIRQLLTGAAEPTISSKTCRRRAYIRRVPAGTAEPNKQPSMGVRGRRGSPWSAKHRAASRKTGEHQYRPDNISQQRFTRLRNPRRERKYTTRSRYTVKKCVRVSAGRRPHRHHRTGGIRKGGLHSRRARERLNKAGSASTNSPGGASCSGGCAETQTEASSTNTAPVDSNDSERPAPAPPWWILAVSAGGDVEEPVRPAISSGYYERSVPSFLAQGRGKGASSTLMSQARLYVESPFPSASHAGHCKPPKMKTSSISVILQLLREFAPKTLRLATCSRQGPIDLAGCYKIWEAPRSSTILQFSRVSNPRHSVIKTPGERPSPYSDTSW